MEPLRCWKELVFGERAVRSKKSMRLPRRRQSHATSMMSNAVHVGVVE
jgi:hypothetical protein